MDDAGVQSEELNVTHFGPPAAELDIRQHWVTFGWQRVVRIKRRGTGVRTPPSRLPGGQPPPRLERG